MKKWFIKISFICVLALCRAYAQPYQHLQISKQHPQAAQPLTFTYNPAGTNLAGKPDIEGTVYFMDNKNYPASDLYFKKENGLYKASTTVPAGAKAFFVKINSGEDVDNNGGEGYIYMIYNNGKPVEEAYAQEAFILTNNSTLHYSKIDKNTGKAYNLYNTEFKLYPQGFKSYGRAYAALLMASKDQKLKELGEKKLIALGASSNPDDLAMASTLYGSELKDKSKADSLTKIITERYPKSLAAKRNAFWKILGEKNLPKKEELSEKFLKNFPEHATNEDNYADYIRQNLIATYLTEGNKDKVDLYLGTIEDKKIKAVMSNDAAFEWAQKGEHLAEAAQLAKQSLEIINDEIAHPTVTSFTSLGKAKKNAQNAYYGYADNYAYILAKQGKYADAINYERTVFEHYKGSDIGVDENYAMMLTGVGDYVKAKEIIEDCLRSGKDSKTLDDQLKIAYTKIKGNDSGYDTYFASLKNTMQDKLRADLIEGMINLPAPSFTLKDFDGNTVSLSSLKGKVVVVDFWATWCGPCKASFPGMQIAVNKYKDDPNVKFLFIDTWENGDSFMLGVKNFIAENKYPFYVLLDEKGEDGRQSKVVSQFKVEGIPTKFIIDKNGDIRFKKVGFMGSDSGLVDELSAMIEIAKKPETIKSSKTD